MPMDLKICAFSKAAPYVLVLKLKRDEWELFLRVVVGRDSI
jgi:hypothetical protein